MTNKQLSLSAPPHPSVGGKAIAVAVWTIELLLGGLVDHVGVEAVREVVAVVVLAVATDLGARGQLVGVGIVAVVARRHEAIGCGAGDGGAVFAVVPDEERP